MKKSISVSNLTLDLYLDYVLPAARAVGVVEEVPARDGDREYIAQVIDEAAADEITHCMYCACMSAHNGHGDYSTEGEAAHMLHNLEVSIEYRHNETVAAIYAALTAMLNTAEQTETEQNEQEADTMNANQTETVKMIPVDELTEGVEPAEICKNLNDYRNSTQYIGDIITEIADGCTSIYYADIMAFISGHPWALADVINEGLFDPSEGYDVYKHGQAAEFMLNERELYNGMEEGLLLVARDMLRYDFEVEEIPETLADLIREFCENETGNSRLSDLADLIREAIETEEEEA